MKNKILVIVAFLIIILGGLFIYFNYFKLESEVIRVETHEMNIDYLKGDNGKLVTIKDVNINCDSFELIMYEDNTYELIKGSKDIKKGKYDFDVLSLFKKDSTQRLSEDNKSSDWIEYALTTGKDEVFISSVNNSSLNSLLDQLNINLEQCKIYEIEE